MDIISNVMVEMKSCSKQVYDLKKSVSTQIACKLTLVSFANIQINKKYRAALLIDATQRPAYETLPTAFNDPPVNRNHEKLVLIIEAY